MPRLLALIQGRQEGWDSRYIQTLFTIAIVSGIAFVVIESRQEHPLVELALFKVIPFSAAAVIFFIGTMGEFAFSFLIALFLQRVMTLTPSQSEQMLLPGALTWGFSNLISGRLATKHGCAPAFSLRPLLVIARQDAGNTTTTCKANASAQWHVQEPQPQEPPPSPAAGPNGPTRSPIFEPKSENFFSSSSEPQFVHSTSTVLVITNFSKSRLQTRQ